jgi:hypothetical protein
MLPAVEELLKCIQAEVTYLKGDYSVIKVSVVSHRIISPNTL